MAKRQQNKDITQFVSFATINCYGPCTKTYAPTFQKTPIEIILKNVLCPLMKFHQGLALYLTGNLNN